MNDFNDELPEDIRLALKAAAPRPGEERVERVLKLLQSESRNVQADTKSVRAGVLFRYLGIAAAAIIAVVAVKYIPTTAPSPSKTYTTTPGQRATITLADGSTMILAPATRAVVDMSKNSRTVTLQGQAYFAVTSDASRSFSVNTAAGTTRVLGTRFTVRQYQDESSMRVAVNDGKVAIPGAVVTAGTAASVSINTEPSLTNNASDVNAWTEGRLIFRNAPVRQVLNDLERWYDIQINLRDQSLANRKVTAILSDAAFTDETLRALSVAFNSRAVRNGRTITFTGVTP